MTILTLLLVTSMLGALLGVRKPWMGGIAGLLTTPVLYYTATPLNGLTLFIAATAFFLLSTAYGFMSFMILSGLKGGGLKAGQTYMSGFGAHHPGGIILSDEELRILKNEHMQYAGMLSF